MQSTGGDRGRDSGFGGPSAGGHAGSNSRGKSSSSHGGGRGNTGGGGGEGGSGIGGRGFGTSVGAGRRDQATGAFGGLAETDTGFGGLVDAAAVGVGAKDRGMSELGEMGWKGAGHRSRAAAADLGTKRGAQMAVESSGLNAVSSLAGLSGIKGVGLGVTGLTEAAEKGMTADEQRGFQDVQSKQTGLTNLGTAAAGVLAGPAGAVTANLALSSLDHARQAAYAKDRYGVEVSQGRRSSAIDAFSGNRREGNTGLARASSPASTRQPSFWQPSTIGFGDYDSHIKGLLS